MVAANMKAAAILGGMQAALRMATIISERQSIGQTGTRGPVKEMAEGTGVEPA